MRIALQLCGTVAWIVLSVALSAGCSNTPKTVFAPQSADKAGNVRVYVYWPGQTWREKAGRSVELQVDRVPMGILRYKTYIPLELPPGNHEFRVTGDSVDADWEGLEKSFVLRLKPDEIEYVRFLVKFDQSKNDWKHLGMKHVVQFLPSSPKVAYAAMKKLEPINQ